MTGAIVEGMMPRPKHFSLKMRGIYVALEIQLSVTARRCLLSDTANTCAILRSWHTRKLRSI